MKKVLNKDFAEIERLHATLSESINTFNGFASGLQGEVNALIERYVEKNGDAIHTNIEEINDTQRKLLPLAKAQADKINSYIEARSDKWHMSDASEPMNDWRNEWLSFCEEFDNAIGFYHFDELTVTELEQIELPQQKQGKNNETN